MLLSIASAHQTGQQGPCKGRGGLSYLHSPHCFWWLTGAPHMILGCQKHKKENYRQKYE